MPALHESLEEFEEHLVFGGIARFSSFFGKNRRVAADLLQASQRREDVNLDFIKPIALDQFDELIARSRRVRFVEFHLDVGELAVVDNLVDRRQIENLNLAAWSLQQPGVGNQCAGAVEQLSA